MTIAKTPTDQIELAWGASCAPTDDDFAVYEGSLGDFSSHTPLLCSSGATTAATLSPGGGNTYYLVAPRNAIAEGSHGLDGNGTERSVGEAACLPQVLGACQCY